MLKGDIGWDRESALLFGGGGTLRRDAKHFFDMDEAFIVRDRIGLTCKGSHVVLHAAEKKAAELGVPECIAVVDAAGELLAFSRMDGARPGSIEIALTKARSAARRRRPTAEEAGGDLLGGMRLALAAQLQVTGIGGGLPIVIEGQTVGGVGVSSGTADEDVEVARAGLEALRA
jgi:glc operon protein GlcG